MNVQRQHLVHKRLHLFSGMCLLLKLGIGWCFHSFKSVGTCVFCNPPASEALQAALYQSDAGNNPPDGDHWVGHMMEWAQFFHFQLWGSQELNWQTPLFFELKKIVIIINWQNTFSILQNYQEVFHKHTHKPTHTHKLNICAKMIMVDYCHFKNHKVWTAFYKKKRSAI